MVRAALLALALCIAGAAGAQPDLAKPAPAPKPAAKQAPAKPKGPAWAELNAEHQAILAPLKVDWDMLERERKQKWIGIAKRYPKMKPDEQARVQRRMQAWANLSPEQRRQARDNYREATKVSREKNKDLRQQWAEYQALPPHERNRLVAEPVPAPGSKKKK